MTYDEYIWTDPDRMGDVPCFRGTRVAVRSLFEHLESGYTVDYFLNQFSTVKREQVVGLLRVVSQQTDERARAGAKGASPRGLLAGISAPIARAVEEGRMSEDELSVLLEIEKHASRAERRAGQSG